MIKNLKLLKFHNSKAVSVRYLDVCYITKARKKISQSVVYCYNKKKRTVLQNRLYIRIENKFWINVLSWEIYWLHSSTEKKRSYANTLKSYQHQFNIKVENHTRSYGPFCFSRMFLVWHTKLAISSFIVSPKRYLIRNTLTPKSINYYLTKPRKISSRAGRNLIHDLRNASYY